MGVVPRSGSHLPSSARVRLTRPLHAAIAEPVELRARHTVPISGKTWESYAQRLEEVLAELCRSVEKVSGPLHNFAATRSAVSDLLDRRAEVIAIVLALQPFERFNPTEAHSMLAALDTQILQVALRIEETSAAVGLPSLGATLNTDWLSAEAAELSAPLSRAFGLESENLLDEGGEFSPARVFSSHYLQNGQLLSRLLLHLESFGLPAVLDPLIAVSVIGWVLSAKDEVAAYCALDAIFKQLLASDDDSRTDEALLHLDSLETALRQNRSKINRSMILVLSEADPEASALALAEVYKRLVEGPVRHYAWLHHCLGDGAWSAPPMLSRLRDALISDSGWMARMAHYMILTSLRNGEAHESLVWDGIDEVFRAEGQAVDLPTVLRATVLADAFARGGEAAVACYKALRIKPRGGAPFLDDPGRLSAWRRAEAFFGTNGLQVTHSTFNSRIAKITCADFFIENINPCFQALVCCHALLPQVTKFEVFKQGQDEVILSVTSEGLQLTHPVWEKAMTWFSSMPLSAFLPANLVARSSSENLARAVRSVAWIAVDDVLDAIDSSPAQWHSDDLDLITKRLDIVGVATGQCILAVPEELGLRLLAVRNMATALRLELGAVSVPIERHSVNSMEPVRWARFWWDAWGPVQRLPGLNSRSRIAHSNDRKPSLRSDEERSELRWRTI